MESTFKASSLIFLYYLTGDFRVLTRSVFEHVAKVFRSPGNLPDKWFGVCQRPDGKKFLTPQGTEPLHDSYFIFAP
jgi:hypothetical protein